MKTFIINGKAVLKMNKPKTLYIIGAVSFPRVDPGASRILELSNLLKDSFDEIVIAGKYAEKPHYFYKFEDNVSLLAFHTSSTLNIVDKLKLLFLPYKFFIEDLKRCILEKNVTHILIYSVLPRRSIKKIHKLAKVNNIKVIFDVVEFQSLSDQSFFSTFTFYLHNIWINKHLIKNRDVITISSYLDNYFKTKGCNSVRIPFTFDSSKISVASNVKNDGKIRLLYAGVPKKSKDLIANCLKGYSLLPKEILENFEFYLAGPSDKIIRKIISRKTYEKIKNYTKILGKINNSDVIDLYGICDFTVLLRDAKTRLAKAGFPTKVSESLVYGVPVICNLSSDLDKYLSDDVNSIIVKSSKPEDFKESLLKVSNKSRDEIEEMKIKARNSFEERLDSRAFKRELVKLFR